VSTLPLHPADEDRVLMELSRELDALRVGSAVRLPVWFTDRVMAAVGSEPLPNPVRALGAALVTRRAGGAFTSIGDAWRVAAGRSTPIAVRAQAFALVLVVAFGGLAVAGGAAAGALSLLSQRPTISLGPAAPIPSEPMPAAAPTGSTRPSPDPSPSIQMSPEASPIGEAGNSPKSTAAPRATDRPRTATPKPNATDEEGGTSGSDGSGGGDSSDGGDQTPNPNPTESDGSVSGSDG